MTEQTKPLGPTSNRTTETQKVNICEMYTDGVMIKDIAKKHGVTPHAVIYTAKVRGMEMRTRTQRGEDLEVRNEARRMMEAFIPLKEIAEKLKRPVNTMHNWRRRWDIKYPKVVTMTPMDTARGRQSMVDRLMKPTSAAG